MGSYQLRELVDRQPGIDTRGRRRRRKPGQRRAGARRFTPRLEGVEDRTLLSTVTSLLDNGRPGTLRFEIAHATNGETIDFDPGLSGTIRLTHGELSIDRSLVINGPGADRLSIDGRHASRVFNVAASGANVAISGLTIADGRARGEGGGILNAAGATLNISGCDLIGNEARGGRGQAGRGGGLFNATGGTVNILGSQFVANAARGGPGQPGEGGGLYSVSDTNVNVANSTFSRNQAVGGAGRFGGHGGGAGINAHGRTTVVNSVITNNRSAGGAGAYGGFAVAGGLINENAIFTNPDATGAALTLVSSTIIGNRAIGGAGHRIGGSAFGGGVLNLAADLVGDGGTISGNLAQAGRGHYRGFNLGGGLVSIGGTVGLNGTLIVGNQAPGGTGNDVFTLLSLPPSLPLPPVVAGLMPGAAGALTGINAAGAPSIQALQTPGASDIAMVSATTPDSRSVAATYNIQGSSASPSFNIAVYRSADNTFDPTADHKLGELTVSGADLTPGSHTVSVNLPGGLPIDPAHPFVLAVADPGNAVAESDEANNLATFRTFVIGAVAHGLEFTPGPPAWISTMAASLRADGYDAAIPFDWSAISSLPAPGLTTLAGRELAGTIVAAAQQLQPLMHPGDVIDLHLIGHSRGGVVISQAALDLQRLEEAGALSPLQAGWLKMTLLDPHPARAALLPNGQPVRTFSASDGPVGQIFQAGYAAFVAAAQDPNVVLPSNVDDAEVYYQRTNVRNTSSPNESPLVNLTEKFFVPWGDVPVLGGPAHYANLTGIVNGHYEVHDWYQQNVVPTLGTAGPFIGPEDPAPPSPIPFNQGGPTIPQHAWAVYEARVLSPAVFRSPAFTASFLHQLSAIELAVSQGRLEETIGRATYLIRDLQNQSQRGGISPEVTTFIDTQLLPALAGLQQSFPGLLVVRNLA